MPNPLEDRELYLSTIADLEEKIARGDRYSLIRASGLLRHLLLDGQTLADRVRSGLKIKLAFEVPDAALTASPKTELDWINLEPGTDNYPCRKVNRDRFLSYVCLVVHGKPIRVQDVIKTCAHVMGGVHSGKSEEIDEALLRLDGQFKVFDNSHVSLLTLKNIVQIALNGLSPVTRAVRAAEAQRRGNA